MTESNYRIFILLFFWSFFSLAGLEAQNTKTSVFDLIYRNDELAEITLAINIDSFLSKRRTNDDVDAVLSFVDVSGKDYRWDANISISGRYRRLRCDFPPFKVDLSKSDLKESGLKKHDKFKVTSHCRENWANDELVFREYLVYRIYNLLTNYSMRAQLARIHYKDTGRGEVNTFYGILIEDDSETADRINADVCKDCYSQTVGSVNQELTCLHDLFQLMIGNSDWSNTMIRNVEFMQPEDGGGGFYVPFDFDFSGFVNAYYATVNSTLGIDNIRQRVYLGFPYTDAVWKKTISYVQSKEDEINQLIEDFPYAKNRTKKDMLKYLHSFFKNLDKLDLDQEANLQQHFANWQN